MYKNVSKVKTSTKYMKFKFDVKSEKTCGSFKYLKTNREIINIHRILKKRWISGYQCIKGFQQDFKGKMIMTTTSKGYPI